jgi:hypothetical protein
MTKPGIVEKQWYADMGEALKKVNDVLAALDKEQQRRLVKALQEFYR